MSAKWKNMSFRLPGKIYKKIKIELIKKDRTFQDLIKSILHKYIENNIKIENPTYYEESFEKKFLKKTLTFRIEEEKYKKLKMKLIIEEISFQETAEKLILAFINDDLRSKNGEDI
jgi:predicted DNA binding CopG/RHH family protein